MITGKNQLIFSVDGVEHFSSAKVHCDNCTTHTQCNRETSYHHADLADILVHHDQEKVFTLNFEPILNANVAKKNDCERNAAMRLCQYIDECYSDLKPILVEDALYANAAYSANYELWLVLRPEHQAGFA